MTPLGFSDWQLAEVLRLAMLITDDRARDRYFDRVAVALRGRPVDRGGASSAGG
jgi:hypothetical protein